MRGCLLFAACALVVMTVGPVHAAPALKVDAPASGCPRRKDVVAALEARVPGLTRTGAGAGTMRRLALEPTEIPGVVQLRLFDDRGVVALERRLGSDSTAAPGARPRADQGCQALAEAVALVVDRYLREIGYRPPAASVPAPSEPAGPGETRVAEAAPPATPAPEAPPALAPAPSAVPEASAAAPPPPTTAPAPVSPAPAAAVVKRPAIDRAGPETAGAGSPGSSAVGIGIGGGARLGPSGAPAGAASGSAGSRGELVLQIGGHRGHLLAELGAGVSSQIAVSIAAAPGAELRLRAFPIRAGLGGWWAAPGGAVIATAWLSADLVAFRAVGLDDPRAGLRFDPAAELGVGYVVQLGPLDVRAQLGGGLTLAPRDFQVGGGDPVYRTPAAYFRSQVQLGWTLWKN